LLASCAAGWLASGTCTVVACYEDCDPCFQQCKCSGQCPEFAQHAGGSDEPYRIAAFESRVQPDGDGRTLRIFSAIIGPSLALARGPAAAGADAGDAERREELARFAARVLAVNRELFPTQPGARWVLDGVDLFASAGVVGFHQGSPTSASDDPRPVHSNGLQLLFDRRGSLVEVDQVFERGAR
jgi:hypothetical protein